jgi:hypothetical protein
MAISLDSLISDVESRAPSPEPLSLLATASATVTELNETTDALLSHFVDRSRRAGHSWSEIGEALGVTKQAVQKRFTGQYGNPRGYEQFTDRVRRLLKVHAVEFAKEMGHRSIGTEDILGGLLADKRSLAYAALKDAGATPAGIRVRIEEVAPRGPGYVDGFTPLAWTRIDKALNIALEMGHNYIGTEHILLSLIRGEGLAGEILAAEGVTDDEVTAYIEKRLGALK